MRRNLFGFAVALILGGLGGGLFAILGIPLAWLLGSAVSCAVAAMARVPVSVPDAARPPVTVAIGVMLGGGFTADTFAGMVQWLPTLAGVAVFLAVGAAVSISFFVKVGRLDLATAYFAGMPGGIVEMALMGERHGGDVRAIALAHASRVLLVVGALPFIILLLGGSLAGAGPPAGARADGVTAAQVLALIAIGLVGAVLGRRSRLPVPDLLGPLLASAIAHLLGWLTFSPPFPVVALALVVMGANVGCRFAGTPLRFVLRMLAVSAGATALLLGLTVLVGKVVGAWAPQGVIPIVLAYSPGGVTEMSIIALSLGIEVAFVVAHHIVRLLFVLGGSGPLFVLVRRICGLDGRR